MGDGYGRFDRSKRVEKWQATNKRISHSGWWDILLWSVTLACAGVVLDVIVKILK